MTSAAVDSDVIHKCCAYGLSDALLADVDELYVLGAARFVLAKKISRKPPRRGQEEALAELHTVLGAATALEPTQDELQLAAAFEAAALTEGLPLDNGESQLAAAVIRRELDRLMTGDKRAIVSMAQIADCQALEGRVICLEQLILRLMDQLPAETIKAAICADETIDRALSSCFACRSPEVPATEWSVGLKSFINDLREHSRDFLAED